ncbi:hypothetical protein AB0J52_01380 [Spirillospora sp. NPDC049652]
MIGYVVSFLVGLALGGVYPMVRQRRLSAEPPGREPATERPSAEELPAAVQESVTAFGEEVAALEFDSDGPEATPAVLKEYRGALEAYRRASAAPTEAAALAAIRDGRAAMIRLDARRSGRPVPIDALPPVVDPSRPPVGAGVGERHLWTGFGEGRTELLIDRPESGRPALVEVDVTGKGYFDIFPVTRTEDEVKTGLYLVLATGDHHGRHYLPADPTHLRVTAAHLEGDKRWAIRILPLSAATALAPEHRGHGDEVLHHQGGPALSTVQFQTDGNWEVRFMCECQGLRPDCDCHRTTWPENTPGEDEDIVHGRGEGRRTLRLPGRGFLVIETGPEEDASWYLTTQPVDIPLMPPSEQPG